VPIGIRLHRRRRGGGFSSLAMLRLSLPLARMACREYAAFMKPIFSVVLLMGVFLCGCSDQIAVDRAAADYLGAGAVHVLSEPSKIEGWNFQRGDGTIASDPPIRPLNLSVAKEVGAILLSQETYRSPARGGGFAHDVGYRIWRGDESVDVLVSFGNDQVQLKYRAYNGQQSSSFASVTAGRDRLIRVAQEAYSDYKAPAR
jgi:hypothetical protein